MGFLEIIGIIALIIVVFVGSAVIYGNYLTRNDINPFN